MAKLINVDLDNVTLVTTPNKLKKLKKQQRYKFYCKECGVLDTRLYKSRYFEMQSLLLCTKCTLEHNNLKKFGVKCYVQTKEFKNKSEETNFKTICVKHPGQSRACREKGVKTYAEKHGIKYVEGTQSLFGIKETHRTNLGVDYPFQSEEIQRVGRDTKQDLYGDPFYNNRQKSAETKSELYGDPNYNNRPKAQQTDRDNHEGKLFVQTKEFVTKTVARNNERFGVDWFS